MNGENIGEQQIPQSVPSACSVILRCIALLEYNVTRVSLLALQDSMVFLYLQQLCTIQGRDTCQVVSPIQMYGFLPHCYTKFLGMCTYS